MVTTQTVKIPKNVNRFANMRRDFLIKKYFQLKSELEKGTDDLKNGKFSVWDSKVFLKNFYEEIKTPAGVNQAGASIQKLYIFKKNKSSGKLWQIQKQ